MPQHLGSRMRDGDPPVFFFGTLMVPAILTRVLGHSGERLTVRDAVLKVSRSERQKEIRDCAAAGACFMTERDDEKRTNRIGVWAAVTVECCLQLRSA